MDTHSIPDRDTLARIHRVRENLLDLDTALDDIDAEIQACWQTAEPDEDVQPLLDQRERLADLLREAEAELMAIFASIPARVAA